jgi:cell division septal protein FtsQ
MRTSVSKTFLTVALPAALGFVILIFGGMEAQRLLTESPKFGVRFVEVLGKGAADSDDLIRMASIPQGTNIFSVDLEAVRKKIERHPWVHDATVARVLPNKIEISYRSQVAQAILGADSMYYLNNEGVPFYRVQKGDSLGFPLVQVEGRARDKEVLRDRVATSVRILDLLRQSPLYNEKDLGDLTVRTEAEDGAAPYVLTLRFPPKALATVKSQTNRLYTVTLGDQDLARQVKHWEAVVRYLVQQGKNPRLIRLELGKKVVVKLER